MHAIRVALLAGLLMGCGNTDKDLCEDFFEPYPDLITGRVVMETNRPFLDAMQAYRKGDHAAVVDTLESYIRMPGFNKTAHLYLANAYWPRGARTMPSCNWTIWATTRAAFTAKSANGTPCSAGCAAVSATGPWRVRRRSPRASTPSRTRPVAWWTACNEQ